MKTGAGLHMMGLGTLEYLLLEKREKDPAAGKREEISSFLS